MQHFQNWGNFHYPELIYVPFLTLVCYDDFLI